MDLNAAGYAYLRTTAPLDTLELEIRVDATTALVTLDATDPRLTVTEDAANGRTVWTLVLSGDDAEVTTAGLPVTVDRGVLKLPDGTVASNVETFTPFTLGAAEDEVTITLNGNLPPAA